MAATSHALASVETVPAPAVAAAQPSIETTAAKDQLELTDQTNFVPRKTVFVVLSGVIVCILVSTLDSVIVATTLPTISAYFHAGAIASWVPSAYLLTSTAFQPLYGRFSDIFGRKAAIHVAMGTYIGGCLAAGFSRNIVELIVFRAIAGAGEGGLASLLQIVVSDVLSLRERGKYTGYVGAFNALGYAVGPLIGGALAEKVSWRWCFWITLPVAAVAMVVIQFALPLKPVQGDLKSKLLAVDYVGSILTVGSCTLLILPLIWGGVTFPWSSAIVLGPLVAGVVLVAIFCCWEWRGARMPIVPMYIFKQTTVVGVYIAMSINGYCYFTGLYYLPQFFQVALGYSPIRSGVFLLPLVMSQVVAAVIGGAIVSHTGRYRPIVYVGFSLLAIGSGCISSVNQHTPKPLMVFFMLMTGLGGGFTMQTTTVAVQASVPRKDMAVVTAVRNFLRMLGGTLALAVASTILNNSLRAALAILSLPDASVSQIIDDPSILSTPSTLGLTSDQAAYVLGKGYTKGFRIVFSINAGLGVVALLASVLLIKHKELTRGDEDKLREEAKERLEREKRGGAQLGARGTAGQGEDIELGMRKGSEGK